MGQLDVRDFLYLGPEILLTTCLRLRRCRGAPSPTSSARPASAPGSRCSLGATAFYVAWLQTTLEGPTRVLASTFVLDGFSFVWKILVLGSMIVVVLPSQRCRTEDAQYRAGEYYSLLFAATGMMFMASGTSLLDLISARADGALELHPGRLLQARAQVERGGAQVLRARGCRPG